MEIQLGNKSISLWALIALLGGILALVAMFLDVASLMGESGTMSQIMEEVPAEYKAFSANGFMIAGILAIIAGILALVPSFADLGDKKKIVSILAVVLALVAVIMSILCIMDLSSSLCTTGEYAELLKAGLEISGEKISLAIGSYLSIIGSLVTLVGTGLVLKDSF